MDNAPNSTAGAGPANDRGAQLVSPTQSSLALGTEMTTIEVAQRLHRSPAWVKRHAAELGARLVSGTYRYPAAVVLERTTSTTRERITIDGRSRAPDRGALASRCFPLFAAAVPLDEVVIRLEADPADIRSLFEEWCRCRELSARYLSANAASQGPSFDHPPSADWDCCPGHRAMHAMEKR